ncbi:MAG: beta-galactosidase [Pseudomonadota bacterium]
MIPRLGVCYYPEHWPEAYWAKDAAAMVDAGITWVRIGEFAWAHLEPNPGQFQFEWLDRAIDTLGGAGLKVVLGTPSATPPRWMLERFPDMLAKDAQGNPRSFGSRRHYCPSNAGYRAAAAEMAAVLGERYGQNSFIGAWQIDNEYGCHDTALSYSDAARDAFRNWLAERYVSVAALNAAWGNAFWSMAYNSFDEIGLPQHTVTQANPAHEMAFRRFSSDQTRHWNAVQVAALRPLTDAPLLHNYMGRELAFDHFALARDLDIATWDSYPIGFLSDRIDATAAHKKAYLRQGDPDCQAFHHDLYRALNKGRWWVMEQQPGPVNWAPYNPAPLPGMVRLWTWEAFAHGAEVVSYFRWRQLPFGQEQMHAGLNRPDDTPAQGLEEARRVAQEIKGMPAIKQTKAPVALLFDYASAWSWEVLPQGRDFSYFNLVFDCYRALRALGLSIDILPLSACAEDLEAYRLILAPGVACFPPELTQALAALSAPCLIGPRSNLMTEEMSTAVPLGPNLPGMDARVVLVESLPPDGALPVRAGGALHRWAEQIEGEAEVCLSRADGAPVLLRAAHLHYLTGWPDATLWTRVIEVLGADVPLTPLPPGLRLRDTATHRFVFNYNSHAVTWDGQEIGPAALTWTPLS